MKKPMMQALAVVAALSMLAAACGAADSAASGIESALGETGEVTSPATDSETSAATSETAALSTKENTEPHAGAYDYDESDVVEISLGTTISATSSSVSIDGTTATITSAGAYEITGTLDDGQIIVDAGDGAVIQLILNGVDITNTDGEVYVFAEGEDEPTATLFSKVDLTVGGAGSLAVIGSYNDGIASKDGLVIDSGTITVTAIDDAIRGKDYVVIAGGEIEITAGGDGIKSDNDEDPERGFVTITDGAIDLTSPTAPPRQPTLRTLAVEDAEVATRPQASTTSTSTVERPASRSTPARTPTVTASTRTATSS